MNVIPSLSSGAFDDCQAKTLTQAFDEALRLSAIDNRDGLHAEAIAQRVILLVKAGETDLKDIARLAAAN
jgi:hypothetical protein